MRAQRIYEARFVSSGVNFPTAVCGAWLCRRGASRGLSQCMNLMQTVNAGLALTPSPTPYSPCYQYEYRL